MRPTFVQIASVLVAGLAAAGERAPSVLPFTVEEPSGVAREAWPVTSGLPWPKGVLKDASRVVLRDSGGRELPCQTRALSKWDDGSVKWLLLDFQVDLAPRMKKSFSLRPGKPRPLGFDSKKGYAIWSLLSAGADTDLAICWPDRGHGLFELRTRRKLPFVALGFDLVGPGGKRFYARPSQLRYEERGPLRSVLLLEGSYIALDGTKLHSYVIRVHGHKGKGFVRLFHTLRVHHPTEVMTSIKNLELSFRVPGAKRFAIGGEPGLAGTVPRGRRPRLFQEEDNLYRLSDGRTGKRAPGWAEISSGSLGVTACVRDFWQQYPKAFSVDGNALHIELMPELDEHTYAGRKDEDVCKLYYYLRGDKYAFKTGVEKTHEILLDFHEPDVGAEYSQKLNAQFQQPLIATASPEWVCATRAMGDILPADGRNARYDTSVEKGFERHLARRERLREYGLINFGDWYGERRVNWGNLEYDLARGLFLQYARTGERRYYDRAVEAARHHIDVDVVHRVNPSMKNPWGPAPSPGEIWVHCMGHTGGYLEKGFLGMTGSPYYKGYSRNMGHVWIEGDLDYYHFTGDPRALETARLVGDAHASIAPGIGWGTHVRDHGWPMILLLAVYEETREQKYLDAARVLAEDLYEHERPGKGGWVIKLARGHCLHDPPQCRGNVPFMMGVVFSALKRYHLLTGDERAARAIVSGVDQIVEECWIPEKKLFRYAACPLSPDRWGDLGCLVAEGIGYAYRVTGDEKYRRLLEETLQGAIRERASDFGKSLAQTMVLTPHALYDLLTAAPGR